MSSRTGKKRSATQNGESSTSGIHASKKTRFVEPDEDPTNFAEQVDSALENPSRKGKVKNEGYESDSSDDGEGVVFSRKKGAGADEEEENDDMFASVKKEGKQEESSGKAKEKFMRLGDIEGQEFGNLSGSEASDNEEDFEDEDARERKKKEGMGFELSSFNMREEMEEGKFTDDGSYVRTYDPHGVHDRWMEGLDDREIKLARRRKREQEKKQREKVEAEERELAESGGQSALEIRLLEKLKRGETVLEALQRLGAQAKRKSVKIPSNPTRQRSTSVDDSMNIESAPKPQTEIEFVTHLASNLMSMGDTDIYSKTYQEIVRHVQSTGNVGPNWEPPSADIKYEYRWDVQNSEQSGEIFGPFAEEELKAWYNASYFGPSGQKVQVRRIGGYWGTWRDVVQ